MRPAHRPEVVLLSSRDTLRGLGPAVRSAGLGFRRIEAIRAEPVGPGTTAARFPPRATVDALVLTSRHAVAPELVAWLRRPRDGRTPELWAAGPGTSERLRRLGFLGVRRGSVLGAAGVVRRLRGRRLRIVHVRSDLAGNATARALRAQGHAVTEIVAYRVRPRVSQLRRDAGALRGAAAVVLASPSVLEGLRAALGTVALRELGQRTPAVVLGERTASAARAAGFRSVSVAPSTTPQRFARLLVRTVTDGVA